MCGGDCHFDFEINSHTFNRLSLGLDVVAQNIPAQKDGAGDQNDDVVQHQHHGHLNALLRSISESQVFIVYFQLTSANCAN